MARSAGSGNSVTMIARITDGGRRRAADALHEAGDDQLSWSLPASPQAAEASVKSGEAGEEDALAADEVAEPAREQQQRAEGDQVGVETQVRSARGEVEVRLDRGEGDVHDRRVERPS